MISGQTTSNDGAYQRIYINPLQLEELSFGRSVESTMNQIRDLEASKIVKDKKREILPGSCLIH